MLESEKSGVPHRPNSKRPTCTGGRVRGAFLAFVLLFTAQVCSAAKTLGQVAVSKAEKFVAASLRVSGEADLGNLPESERTIRAEFLQKILFSTDTTDIRGPEVTISGATVDGRLYPPKSQWNLGKGSTVTRHISFEHCHFDLVNLNGVTFQNGLVVESSDFQALILGGIHLKGRMILEKITIRPSTDEHSPGHLGVLLSGNIEGTLQVGDISPLLNAGGLTATHVQILELEAHPPSDVNLAGLQADDLIFDSFSGKPASLGTLSLADATIKNKVALQSVRVDNLSALSLHAGILYLRDAQVRELLDLSRATLGVFLWDASPCDNQTEGVCWPKRIFVAGLSFGELNVQPFVPPSKVAVRTAGNKTSKPPESDLNLTREFLRHADFSEPLYASYSQFLRTRGLIAAADDAQLAMHAHKRKARWHEAHGFFGDLGAVVFVAIDLAQLIFLGYGQSALPPLLWALIFVLIGTAVFRNKERMEVVGEHPPRFSAFWYSLELFLPVVDLGVAKSWRPSQKSIPLLTYARIHQLAGWILIPVALATLTGAFK